MTISTVGRPASAAYLAVLGGALLLSVSGIMVKLAGLDAETTAVVRLAIAVVVLIPLAITEGSRRRSLSRRGVIWAVVAGAALGLDYAAWTSAIFMVGAGVSAVLVNIQVIVLPLIAFLVDRERPSLRFIVTAPIMLFGISMLGGLWNLNELGDQVVLGTILCLLAGIGYSIYLFLSRRVTRSEGGLLLQPLTWATLSATITTAAVAPFTGGIHLTGISAASWGWLVAMGVLGYVAAWLLVQFGSAQLPPAVTAAMLLTQPVLALVLSAIIVDEYPTSLQIVGAVVVIGAIAFANGMIRFPRRTPRATPDPVGPEERMIDRAAPLPGPVVTGPIDIIRPDHLRERDDE